MRVDDGLPHAVDDRRAVVDLVVDFSSTVGRHCDGTWLDGPDTVLGDVGNEHADGRDGGK